jgi:hypothetical protein
MPLILAGRMRRADNAEIAGSNGAEYLVSPFEPSRPSIMTRWARLRIALTLNRFDAAAQSRVPVRCR